MNAPVTVTPYLPELNKGMLSDYDDWCAALVGDTNIAALSDDERWHLERRMGIGASEVATALGLNPWKTPGELWEEKTGRREPADLSDNLRVRVGIKTEAVVAELYAEDHGVKLRRHRAKAMKGAPWVRCNPDRLVVGQRKGLEIKTGRLNEQWGASGTDEVPMSYLLQVTQCMAVFGYGEWDLAAELFGPGGVDLRYYPLVYSEDVAAPLIEQATRWWFDHVIEDRRPDPVTAAEVSLAYPSDDGSQVLASAEVAEQVAAARELAATIKAQEEELSGLKTEIQRAMGEGSVLVDQFGAPLASWKKAKDSERFDASAFKKAHPDLAAQFTKVQTGSRRFLLK
jgi:putative phage-type endonuclease